MRRAVGGGGSAASPARQAREPRRAARPSDSASPRAASTTRRQVEPRARRRVQRRRLGDRPPRARRGRDPSGSTGAFSQAQRRGHVDAGVEREDVGVDLVDRVLPRVPPPGEARACRRAAPSRRRQLGVLLREPGERHEGRRARPMPQNDWSPAREKRRARGRAGPVTSGTTALREALRVLGRVQHGVVGGAARAGRVDVEVQRRSAGGAPATRDPRTRPSRRSARASGPTRRRGGAPAGARSRRAARRRATSSIVAFAVPLSMAPKCQASTWPEKRTKRSSALPARCADQVRDRHPARAHARHQPHAAAALADQRRAGARRRRRRTDRHGMRGMRQAVSGAGVPQIVVTIMLWR